MTPAFFVIGDSLPFSVRNVRGGRDGDYLPGATVTYVLLDDETRAQITSGTCLIYDNDTASFEAAIPDTALDVYDPEDNPNGVIPNREYLLRATIDNSGVKTSRAVKLVALLDPPPEELV